MKKRLLHMGCLEERLDKNVIIIVNYKLNQLIQCFSICVNFNSRNSPVSMLGAGGKRDLKVAEDEKHQTNKQQQAKFMRNT